MERLRTEVDGLSMHVLIWVRSAAQVETPMVLVHGLVVSSRYMVPLARCLAGYHNVYAPDLPGFGLSEKPRQPLAVGGMADALAGWVRAVGLERPLLVGNSLGCQVAVEYAVRHPEAVSGLVLTGPTMDPSARTPLDHAWRWLLNLSREDPRILPVTALDFFRAGPRRTLHTYIHGLEHPIEERLPWVVVPALVVRGSEDTIVPDYWARDAARLLPRGRYLEIPGTSHALNFSNPEPLARAIISFARELETQPAGQGSEASQESSMPS